MATEKQLGSHLRHALRHLYDLDVLRSNRLIGALGLSGKPRAVSMLTDEITRAIESLKPQASVPAHSRYWRVYEILCYRYVQQCSQQEVASQLGLSIRQLRREEQRATEELARRLAERCKLELEAEPAGQDRGPIVKEAGPAPSPFDDDLMWLRNPPPDEAAELASLLPTLAQLAEPMAARYGVSLEIASPQHLPALAGHAVAIRQILLSLLGVAIRRAPGGRVTLAAGELEWQVEIRIRGASAEGGAQAAADDAASLEMAQRLVGTCGGSLALSSSGEPFWATVTLPAVERLPILVIDDNVDALQMFQRYSSGTAYQVIGVRDPEQALAAANGMAPRLIVLDVMMPGIDGWEVLGRLRQHPLTSSIPVIVCSILAEEELAFSLGASGFVRKPVTRQDFLSALDRHVHPKPAGR